MARYAETIMSLLQKEDETVTKIEDVKDDIVDCLYMIDRASDAAEEAKAKAKAKLEELRKEEDKLITHLDAVRGRLRRALLRLFE